MNSLYEKLDNLKDFTALKEDIVKKEDSIITSIKLNYENVWITLREIAIKGFNKFDNKGYLIANMEPFILDEAVPEFYTVLNEIKVLIVCFSNGSTKEYGITWCSPFNKIEDDMYIMLFETNNGEYYLENSKS